MLLNNSHKFAELSSISFQRCVYTSKGYQGKQKCSVPLKTLDRCELQVNHNQLQLEIYKMKSVAFGIRSALPHVVVWHPGRGRTDGRA